MKVLQIAVGLLMHLLSKHMAAMKNILKAGWERHAHWRITIMMP
jgi:hypothetical protein